jgi:hypothetical protein
LDLAIGGFSNPLNLVYAKTSLFSLLFFRKKVAKSSVPVFVIYVPLLKADHLSELAASSWYPTFNALFLIKKNAPT